VLAALVERPPIVVGEETTIAPGVDPDLDALRELRDGGRDAIARIQSDERTRTGIASLKVGFNKVFGYYIEVTDSHRAKVPPPWSRKQTVKNAERYVTDELKKFEEEALGILSASKNVRLLRCAPPAATAGPEFRPVSGGMLLQSADQVDEPGDDPANWELKAGPAAGPAQLADLAFAWKACRSVKSNAILLASGGASVGIGMGQVNRVDSARLAVLRAGDRAAGSVAASDAYFPFADGFEILAEAGVRAVAEPGGSIRDHLTVTAAEAAGVSLYFTGVRHFFH